MIPKKDWYLYRCGFCFQLLLTFCSCLSILLKFHVVDDDNDDTNGVFNNCDTQVWCPHCARQKELFGREAWKYIDYVECAPQGYGSQPGICQQQDIDGFPTWVFSSSGSTKNKNKVVLAGERPLEDLAQQVNWKSFQPSREQNLPPPLGSASCKQ